MFDVEDERKKRWYEMAGRAVLFFSVWVCLTRFVVNVDGMKDNENNNTKGENILTYFLGIIFCVAYFVLNCLQVEGAAKINRGDEIL